MSSSLGREKETDFFCTTVLRFFRAEMSMLALETLF
jgi:hypothetical protein